MIINHEWNFLSQPVATSGAKKPTHHTHTLKAGIHAFPFSMMIESDTTFPSSLRTWNNEAHVSYKLRAVAIRSGAFSSNFQATKTVNLLRTYTSEALEFTQTLEIENSWPLKVAYSLTLPHKFVRFFFLIGISARPSDRFLVGVERSPLVTTSRSLSSFNL